MTTSYKCLFPSWEVIFQFELLQIEILSPLRPDFHKKSSENLSILQKMSITYLIKFYFSIVTFRVSDRSCEVLSYETIQFENSLGPLSYT